MTDRITFGKSSILSGLSLGAVLLMATSASAHFIGVGGNNSIDGSLCVGNDCVAEEAFGFDTIRLKENNLRLHFQDTSSSASFPPNDWRIIINDSTNGGASYFGVEDSSAGRIPFRVSAGARNHALFVDSQGDVGIGTSTPATDIDIKIGDSPTVRLQQDGTSGFTPQSWDLAGNETNFFVRDVTNGSTLPFKVFPSAPSDSLTIEGTTGDIGMGTRSPGAALPVLAGGSAFAADSNTVALFQNNANTGDVVRFTLLSGATGNDQIAFADVDNEFQGRIRYFHNTDTMDFLTQGNVVALALDGDGTADLMSNSVNGAVLTAAGVWQNASSRSYKQDIKTLDLASALDTLDGLEPVTYSYKTEPEELTVGFIAEDVPDLVATASRKTLSGLDIVAVLTRVVQQQQDVIAGLETRLQVLEADQN